MARYEHMMHPQEAPPARSPLRAVGDTHDRGDRIARYNTWLAVMVTRAVGSMWCAYLFAAVCLIGLPDAVRGGAATLISWIAQTFLQLVLLSVIMVGQNAEADAAERRSQAMYDAMTKDTELLLQRQDRSAEQIAAQSRVLTEIALRLGG